MTPCHHPNRRYHHAPPIIATTCRTCGLLLGVRLTDDGEAILRAGAIFPADLRRADTLAQESTPSFARP